MIMKKLMVGLLTGAMVLSLAACGGKESTTTPDTTKSTDSTDGDSTDGNSTDGDSTDSISQPGLITPNTDPVNTTKTDETITIGLSSEPATLYGAAGGTATDEEQIISGAYGDTLVKYDYANKEVVPNLATKWEWTDDTHLKFTLRDDVKMTDGTPLVADDVVYSCNDIWIKLNQTNDTGKYMVGATADDEHTVTIEFNTVAPDFVTMMSWANFIIISEDEVNAAGGLDAIQTNPVMGSGKYKFKEWKNGQSITLERNEDYWNKDYVGYYKEIVFTFTSDATSREMAVESGDAQVALNMPAAQAATYVVNDTVNVSIHGFGQTAHLWYNMGENAGATADQKVREAIDKALDFDAIAQVATAGSVGPAASYWDPSCTYYKANYTEEERAVDIEGAKALLEEAGYGDGLKLKALTLSFATPIFTVMQANLDEVGIKLELDSPDTAQFVEGAFGGNYDIIMVGDSPSVRVPANVMPFLQKLNVNGPGMVIGGPKWTSDEFDSTITDLIREIDPDKTIEIATKLDEMIKDQTICSNLYSEVHATIYAKELKGYCTRERGYTDPTAFYK